MTKLSSEEADKVLRNYPFCREFIEAENQLDSEKKLGIFLDDLKRYRFQFISEGVNDTYLKKIADIAKETTRLYLTFGKKKLIDMFIDMIDIIEKHNESFNTEEYKGNFKSKLDENREKLSNSLGLGIVENPIHSYIIGEGNSLLPSSTDIELEIVNANTFVAFLHMIDKSDIKRKLKEKIIITAEILSAASDKYYFSHEQNDEVINFLGNVNPLLREYKRLDLLKKVKKISLNRTLLKRKYLKEYYLLKVMGCFGNPESNENGPWKWHRDKRYRYKDYEEVWEARKNALEKAMKNHNAHKLVKVAVKNLIAFVEYADNDIDNITKNNMGHYLRSFKTILEKYYNCYKDIQKKL